MARRITLVLLVVLLGLVVAWFVQRSGRGPQNATASPSIAASARDVDRRELERDGAAIRMREVAKPSAAPCDAGENELCIDVVDAHGAPVSDAQVWWLDEESLARALADPVACMSGDPEQLYLQHGTPHATDEQGRAHVPKSEQRSVAYCRIEDCAGKVWIPPGADAALRLELVPAGDLRVRVVDSEGRGVRGVSVALYSGTRGRIAFTAGISMDADGLALLPLARRFLVATPEDQVLVLRTENVDSVPKRVEVAMGDGSPIVLTVERPIELRVRLELPFDFSGRILGRVTIERQFETIAEKKSVPIARRERSKEITYVRDPSVIELGSEARPSIEVVFSPIEPGSSWRIVANLSNPALQIEVETDPPLAPNEARTIVLPGPTVSIVRARLVGEGGEVARYAKGSCAWRDEAGVHRRSAWADHKGRFLLAVRSRAAVGEVRARVITVDAHAWDTEERSAVLDLAPRLPEFVEVGDVVLRESEVFLEGRVVDRDGNAIEGVPVSTREREDDPLRVEPQFEVRRTTVTDSDGRFALRGRPLERWVQIFDPIDAVGGGPLRTFEVGARDVKLVLERGGGVAGRIRWVGDELSIGPTPLVLRLVAEDSQHAVGWTRAARDGSFLFTYARSGPARLEVLYDEEWYSASNVPIDVRAGEVVQPPELAPLKFGIGTTSR